LDVFQRCFREQSVDLLVAKIKSGELDAYATLDKFVGWLDANAAASKAILNLIFIVLLQSLTSQVRRGLRRLGLTTLFPHQFATVELQPAISAIRALIVTLANSGPCGKVNLVVQPSSFHQSVS
jgi:hypothetical protein